MKLGNVSQTITSVPNFFINNSKEIEGFTINYRHKINNKEMKKSTSFFRDKDFFTMNIDINLSHNPRIKIPKNINLNKEVYKPIYKKILTPNRTIKKTKIFPDCFSDDFTFRSEKKIYLIIILITKKK